MATEKERDKVYSRDEPLDKLCNPKWVSLKHMYNGLSKVFIHNWRRDENYVNAH